jgi:cytidine deaminase
MAITKAIQKHHTPLSPATEARLLKAAIAARKNAYCPYSNYQVGASVLASSGRIYTGANIENSSYGLTVCAERNAIFNAIGSGERELQAVCVVAKSAKPCGACRQVMSEFLPKDAPVIIANLNSGGQPEITRHTLARILPMAFDPSEAGL